MTAEIDFVRLTAEVPAGEIKWLINREPVTMDGVLKAKPLAYVDARWVEERLDDVCGAGNWRDEIKTTGEGFLCTLYLRINGEWVGKSDGAGPTKVEPFKGGCSEAFKRAAVKWGIARDLYDIPTPFVEVEQRGKSYVVAKNDLTRLLDLVMRVRARRAAAQSTPAPAKPSPEGAPKPATPAPAQSTAHPVIPPPAPVQAAQDDNESPPDDAPHVIVPEKSKYSVDQKRKVYDEAVRIYGKREAQAWLRENYGMFPKVSMAPDGAFDGLLEWISQAGGQ